MERYEKIKQIGTGSFGTAYAVKSRQSQRTYVIKEILMTAELSSQERERIFNEVNTIKSCCHVNIIRYKETFVLNESMSNQNIDENGRGNHMRQHGVPTICIVMEYADAGDLHETIRKYREEKKKNFPEDTVRNWLVQILFALQYLHKNSILHRDLKTQNIFMTSNRLLKIGDFGISKTLSHVNDFATTAIGTPQNLSPEIIKQQKYDYKTDIWGLGCVLYEICSLNPPFGANDIGTLFQSIVRGSYRQLPKLYSQNLSELVKVMLRPDPHRRPTVAQLLAAKVLQDDVARYMAFIQALPEPAKTPFKVTEEFSEARHGKSSSGSISSISSLNFFEDEKENSSSILKN